MTGRLADLKSRRAVPMDDWTGFMRREASARQLWARVGLTLTLIALLAAIALRIGRG